MPPAVSAEHCGNQSKRKDSSNPGAAWLDFYVPGLLRGIYGTKKWMAEIGRSGRSIKTAAKKRAARVNRLKGQAATVEGNSGGRLARSFEIRSHNETEILH
jgi:hypothetical protein